MKALAMNADAIQEITEERDAVSTSFGDAKQHALWRDTIAEGYDTWLYCGITIELKFYDGDREWLEINFLTDDEVFVWRKDGRNKVPADIRRLVEKHGYRVHTDYRWLPQRLRDILTA